MSMEPKRLIALAAGGTAGHVFPAIALAEELEARGHRLILMTDHRGGAIRGLDRIPVRYIRAGGLVGKTLFRRAAGVAELGIGIFQARNVLKRVRPDAVIGFGGYASVPTMIAATMLHHKTAIHEQNAILGRANRLLARRVDRVALSFVSSLPFPDGLASRTIHTGMPVRPGIAEQGTAPRVLPPSSGTVGLLVTGGSQGASIMSGVVPAAVALLRPELRRRLKIVQQCRREDKDQTRTVYQALNVDADLAVFFDDLPKRIADADLMICRAGASSVAEALVAGRPTILVPYPHAVDEHQSANARAVVEAGAGWLMDQSIFAPERLAERLESLIDNPRVLNAAARAAYRTGRADAAPRLASMVEDLMMRDGTGLRSVA